MRPFADRLIEAIKLKGNPCVIGLDPRIDLMPNFITREALRLHGNSAEAIRFSISNYHRRVIKVLADLVPAVKPQIAFYEQYGIPGIMAFCDTLEEAKRAGLLVIVDAKRNDISSTAQAYANAFLGRTFMFGTSEPIFDADCITVSPYLGKDSIKPFVDVCLDYGKGIFILVKTSNPGSNDLQNLEVKTNEGCSPLYVRMAKIVNEFAVSLIGSSGYSSIGAVVGATFPKEAEILRELMPQSVFLVPGYGAQGGSAEDAALCFNKDGLGAVVNSSRSVTYNFESLDISEREFDILIYNRVMSMADSVNGALKTRTSMV